MWKVVTFLVQILFFRMQVYKIELRILVQCCVQEIQTFRLHYLSPLLPPVPSISWHKKFQPSTCANSSCNQHRDGSTYKFTTFVRY